MSGTQKLYSFYLESNKKMELLDPFFHYYSSIYISEGIKVSPISIHELKADEYLVNTHWLEKFTGYKWVIHFFSSEDYNQLLELLKKKEQI